jgi:hypothetical protein
MSRALRTKQAARGGNGSAGAVETVHQISQTLVLDVKMQNVR